MVTRFIAIDRRGAHVRTSDLASGAKTRSKGEEVGSVVDGSLPEVEPAPSDDVIEGQPDAAGSQSMDELPPQRAPRKRRRGLGAAIFTLLRKLWIPLVILAVVAAGGFTVSRLHGVFGAEKSLTYGDTPTEEAKTGNPKLLRYEIFGPPGTIAQISFFNDQGDPQFLDAVALPWTLEFPITGAAGIGSIAAQGDSDSLGCRILVDNVVKDEKIETHEASTFTSCILKAA